MRGGKKKFWALVLLWLVQRAFDVGAANCSLDLVAAKLGS